jgi:hypothetical protein
VRLEAGVIPAGGLQEFFMAIALRPDFDSLGLRLSARAREVIAEVVQAVDNRKTVVIHGNNEQILDRVRATVGMFVGGGHA